MEIIGFLLVNQVVKYTIDGVCDLVPEDAAATCCFVGEPGNPAPQ
jgi:hypothetical protein